MSTGQIHDLGYKRYVGSRRSVGTRWTVIMRHQLAAAWKGWLRFKPWLIAAQLATAGAGTVLYLLRGELLRMLGGLGGQAVRFADGILPLSTVWYCKVGFLASLFLCSTVVAGDVQSGAFTFYFARSVRPRDYLLGKLAGLCLLLSLIMLVGPVLLAGLRLGLSDDTAQLVAMLPVIPKALAIGVLGTLVYAAVPLGFSAVVSNPRQAMVLWAAYDVVFGTTMARIAGRGSAALAAFDLPSSLQSVSYALFDMRALDTRSVQLPVGLAVISILGHTAIAIGLVLWRVRRAQQTGVGGAS
jgi:ABC-type transport system involved in multi-copper enzyme maturation permease subunit